MREKYRLKGRNCKYEFPIFPFEFIGRSLNLLLLFQKKKTQFQKLFLSKTLLEKKKKRENFLYFS